MLNNLKKKTNDRGFTIIEVMIVLAIAGLIILIVLLAVPALQRNGRNTAIKNDASAIVAGIATFASDNDGKVPAAATDIKQVDATVTIGAAGTSQSEAKVQAGTNIKPQSKGGKPGAAITPGDIEVHVGEDCQGNPSSRAVAVWYSIETAKGAPSAAPFNNKCLDS